MKWFSGLIVGKLLKRKSKVNDSNVISQPQSWAMIIFLLSFVCVAILLVATIFPSIFGGREDSLIMILISGVMFLLFVLFYVYLVIWEVEVFDSYFRVKSIFKSKKISYDNIEVRDVRSGFRFYDNNKHLLSISYLQDNYRILSDVIKKYQKANKIKIKKSITNVLRPIKGLWFSAIILAFITILVTVIIFIEDGMNTAFYISIPFNIFSILIVLYMMNWKIKFDDNHLIKKSIFGVTKKYELEDITFLESQFLGNPNDTKIFYKNKRIAYVMGNINNLQELQAAIKVRNKTK